MRLVYEDEIYQVKVFKPNLFNLFAGKLRILNLHENLRFLLAFIHGYKIYYLLKDTEEVGYCVISRGGSIRYPFASSKDIIVGPYYIKENYRGKRLSIFLINLCIKHIERDYEIAFDFIQKNNLANIRATLSCGFEYLNDGKYTKYLRILKSVGKNNGDYFIYKFENNKMGVA